MSGLSGIEGSHLGGLVVWAQFLACAALIVYSGSRLAWYADLMAEKTGLGRTWIGVVLLATMTSLPELLTVSVAVTAADVPDIAAGDIFGACVFNLMIIAILDLAFRPGPVLSRAEQGHILSAGFGILMLTLWGMGLFAAMKGVSPSLGWVGLYTPVNLVIYFVAIRMIFRMEKRKMAASLKSLAKHEGIPAPLLYRRLGLHGTVIVAAAVLLPFAGKELAAVTGWGNTFVGTILIAMSTTLPEVVTSLAALRIGAIDLALGNLFGSILFNLMILSLGDLLYLPGPILSAVSETHLLPILSSILMSGIAVVSLLYQPEKKLLWTVSWISVLILAVYLLTGLGIFVLETGG